MRYCIFFFLGFIVATTSFSQCYTVENVPNTKLVNNSYVSDPDNLLSGGTVAEINGTLEALEQQTSVQIAVIVVNEICSGDIFGFAQELFESWGIGQKENDNGVLVVLALNMRTVRFHTGYGIEGILTDALCKRIQTEEMIPYFKEGDYDGGMVAGIKGISKVLTDEDYLEELHVDMQREEDGWPVFMMIYYFFGGIVFLFSFGYHQVAGLFSNSKKQKQGKYKQLRLHRYVWLVEFGLIPALIPLYINFTSVGNPVLLLGVSIYIYFLLTLIHKRVRMSGLVSELGDNYFKITELYRHYQVYWLVMGIIFPIPMLLHFFNYLNRKNYYRNHPRDCPKCSNPLKKLGEKADDEYLKDSQVFEEELGSVDYDVWLCSNCSYKTTLVFKSKFTKYKKCPKCKTIAYYTESRTTVVSPTYESSGQGEERKLCKFCNHSQVTTYTIAKLTRSSSSSSGGSSGGGGGSWGGGSSGGGGASSSW